ncbi:hypothetical protein CERZMDRAFT_92121 [Cercospora zeae-maydis SCOH1-5]|uniref:Uncharacterized protein n=1 Tax=Cercospora zeae-maydis SCOH1-5 TaxID=717836 RepID=A0A6A6FVH7_9PEZI|nr:hypothetical protein CERZMDRAFT_92121 [Cercospora zeae-maydis SCOH1-5]
MSNHQGDQRGCPTHHVADEHKYPFAEEKQPRENPSYSNLRSSTNSAYNQVGTPFRRDRLYQQGKPAYHAFSARQAENDAIKHHAMTKSVDQAAAREFRVRHSKEKEQASKLRAHVIPPTAFSRAVVTPRMQRHGDWDLRGVGPRHQPLRTVSEQEYRQPFRTASTREYHQPLRNMSAAKHLYHHRNAAAAPGRRFRLTEVVESAEKPRTGGAKVWNKPLKKSGEDWEREIAEGEARRIRGHGLEQEREITAKDAETLKIRGHGLEQPMVKRRQTWGFKEKGHKM